MRFQNRLPSLAWFSNFLNYFYSTLKKSKERGALLLCLVDFKKWKYKLSRNEISKGTSSPGPIFLIGYVPETEIFLRKLYFWCSPLQLTPRNSEHKRCQKKVKMFSMDRASALVETMHILGESYYLQKVGCWHLVKCKSGVILNVKWKYLSSQLMDLNFKWFDITREVSLIKNNANIQQGFGKAYSENLSYNLSTQKHRTHPKQTNIWSKLSSKIQSSLVWTRREK